MKKKLIKLNNSVIACNKLMARLGRESPLLRLNQTETEKLLYFVYIFFSTLKKHLCNKS